MNKITPVIIKTFSIPNHCANAPPIDGAINVPAIAPVDNVPRAQPFFSFGACDAIIAVALGI